jgi:hypothetical protein
MWERDRLAGEEAFPLAQPANSTRLPAMMLTFFCSGFYRLRLGEYSGM